MKSQFKKIVETITLIDQFGKPINFQINGNQTHKTIFGSFITLIIYGFVFYTFISEVLYITSFSEPILVFQEEFNPDPELFELEPNKFSFNIIINDDSVTTVQQEEGKYLFIPQLQICTRTVDKQGYVSNCTNVLINKCSSIYQQEIYSSLNLKNMDIINQSYCLSESQWQSNKLYLQGYIPSDLLKYLQINILKCTNNTFPGIQCAPQEVIDDKLSSGYLGILFADYQISPKREIPYQIYGKALSQTFTLNSFTMIETYWRHTYTFTKKNFFYYFGVSNTIDHTISFERQIITPNLKIQENKIISVLLILDEKSQNIYRSYKNILNILGDIGGLLSMLLVFGKLIMIPFGDRILFIYLAKILYSQNQQIESSQIIPNLNFEEIAQLFEPNSKREIIDMVKEGNSHFLNKMIEKKLNQLPVSYRDYFTNRSSEISSAIDKVNSIFDITYIFKKMKEIDQIKKIIFTKDQRRLFNFLKKPTIESKNKKNMKFQKMEQLQELFLALKNIYYNVNKNQLEINLINNLDQNIIKIFEQLQFNLCITFSYIFKANFGSINNEHLDEQMQVRLNKCGSQEFIIEQQKEK